MQGCRVCGGAVREPFFDLGLMPLANDYQTEPDAVCQRSPLAVWECSGCGLVQLTHVVAPEVLYREYPYLTGCSTPMASHFEALAESFAFPGAKVVDIGSNDGTLPAAFATRGCTAIGIEPARNIECKVPKITRFLDETAVAKAVELLGGKADVVTATNVCAHVDDLLGFLGHVRSLLSPEGLFVAEWPDWVRTAEAGAFDQIYHEHLSYFTRATFSQALRRAGLLSVREYPTLVHGGSCLVVSRYPRANERITDFNLVQPDTEVFVAHANWRNVALRRFFETNSRSVAGYGAPAKATTLLNAVHCTARQLPYVVDSTPGKQGRYIPGTDIPIRPESELGEPEVVVILAWNFAKEIKAKLPSWMSVVLPMEEADWHVSAGNRPEVARKPMEVVS